MKKLFKKSIACLIAVLMVVSTMPLTAVTASAATITETDIANATTNRVVIKDAIYTYASSSAYYNYGTTISTDKFWNTPITSTSTITKVECLDDASVLSVTDGKLSGSFASDTFKVSGATDVFATLKFTFSDNKVEYHKVAVKSYPIENHAAVHSWYDRWNGNRESGYTLFLRGSTGSAGTGVFKKFSSYYGTYKTDYNTNSDGNYGNASGTVDTTADKKAGIGFTNQNDAFPTSVGVGTYYIDKSCYGTNWSNLGNSELWNGSNYSIKMDIVRTKFTNALGDLSNTSTQRNNTGATVSGSYSKVDTNGATSTFTFTATGNITKASDYNYQFNIQNTSGGSAGMRANIESFVFDKSVARNLYTTCLNSATDGSEYTASSFLAYQNALLEMEAYLSNYEDATDATTSQAVYTNLNNAKNSLQSLYCTVTFSDAFFNTTTVKVREGATVPADQFPTLTSPRQLSNKTQHTRYYFKNIADGSEFTTTTAVTSDVSVIETSITEDCSGGTATCTSLAVCDVCNSTYGLLADHSWGDWTSISDTQHKRVCENDSSHVETEKHNIVNGACTECDYKAFDMAAYNDAVAEYGEIIGAGDYAEKYTVASRTAYQKAVTDAKKDSFASQEEVDAAANAILSAKTKLVYAQPEIKFVEVDAAGKETVIETKNYTYGTPVEFTKDADNIAKWIVKTQNGNVETKVATSQTTYTMIATEPATVYVYLTEEKTEALEYSKVSFIGKNGAVSSVQYVAKGETIETKEVPKVEIPFYKFVKWNKDKVTADGSDIEVKAVYKFIGTEDDKCNVHYNDTTKTYTYDSFVYLFGAEDKKLALATDAQGKDIITYLNENAFYAPHTKDIYVIEVDSPQQASIGITGSYMQTNNDDTKTAAFNCKFYVPDDTYEVVEYGMIATSSKGSMKIKAEKASGRGEYCIKISSNEVKSISGQAYLTYKTASGFETIYSTTVTQNLR